MTLQVDYIVKSIISLGETGCHFICHEPSTDDVKAFGVNGATKSGKAFIEKTKIGSILRVTIEAIQ